MKKFGLIGKRLDYSFSQKYFSTKFKKEGLTDYSYSNFELKNIEEFKQLLDSQENLSGLNVTNPYKSEIIPYLSELDDASKSIGAVNTVVFKENKLIGYNTDVIGFRKAIKPFYEPKHSRALIFGTGGSAKAISYVLDRMQVPFYFVSRSPKLENEISYQDLDTQNICTFRFLINCTPVGTAPNTTETLPIPFEGITKNHLVFDLVYNPEETILLKKAKEKNAIAVNGLSMLRLQAEASWEIWNK